MYRHCQVGKLYLVDLAGSERLKKSGSVGLRAHEARSINLSLTSLGMCINARAQESNHVPFRDSKLTRLLQVGWLGVGGQVGAGQVSVAPCRQEAINFLTLANNNVAILNKQIAVSLALTWAERC